VCTADGWRITCSECQAHLCQACDLLGGHPHAGPRVKEPAATVVPVRPLDVKRFGDALGPFASRLLASLATQERGGRSRDLLVCPLSVAAALSLAAAGALPRSPVGLALDALLACGPAGADAAAWLSAWGASVAASPEARLVVANSAWIAANVKPSYAQTVAVAFGAYVAPLQGATPINEWVSAATQGAIREIISHNELTPDVRFVLVNAVHFKASWSKPFERRATVLSSFAGFEATVPCALMFRGIDSFGESTTPGTVVAAAPGRGTVVALPYGRLGRFRAVFVLPEAHGSAALDALVEQPALVALLALALAPGRAKVNGKVELFVPRFRAEFGPTNLAPALKALGLGSAFDERVAPPCFVPIVEDEPVHIQKVVHKVVVDVNEEGTEAAAATAVIGVLLCALPPPTRVVFNRPFAFFILDTANFQSLMLFGGRVVDPSFDTSGTNGAYVDAVQPVSLPPPRTRRAPLAPPRPPRAFDTTLFTATPCDDVRAPRAFVTLHPGLLLLCAADSAASRLLGLFGGGGSPELLDDEDDALDVAPPRASPCPIACVQLLKTEADACILLSPAARPHAFTARRGLLDASRPFAVASTLRLALTNLSGVQRITVQLTACDANGCRANPFAPPSLGEWPLEPGQSVVTPALAGTSGTHVAVIVTVHTKPGDWSINGCAWEVRVPAGTTAPLPGIASSSEPFVPERLPRQRRPMRGAHVMPAPVAVLALP
jgi:serpin B